MSASLAINDDHQRVNIPILMYHDIRSVGQPITPLSLPVAQFERQLDLLVRWGFTTLSFARLFEVLRGRLPMPAKPVVLTFDDGYASFHDLVWPMCSARQMSATVFLLANGIGGSNHWDAANGVPQVSLMDDAQVRSVLKGGMELGVHGWNHRRLMECAESEIREEVVKSKHLLEEKFGQVQTVYCYAYGKFDARLFPVMREAGYQGAVAIDCAWKKTTSELFAMRRIHIHEKDDGWRFLAKLTPPYLWHLGYKQSRAQ